MAVSINCKLKSSDQQCKDYQEHRKCNGNSVPDLHVIFLFFPKLPAHFLRSRFLSLVLYQDISYLYRKITSKQILPLHFALIYLIIKLVFIRESYYGY